MKTFLALFKNLIVIVFALTVLISLTTGTICVWLVLNSLALMVGCFYKLMERIESTGSWIVR